MDHQYSQLDIYKLAGDLLVNILHVNRIHLCMDFHIYFECTPCPTDNQMIKHILDGNLRMGFHGILRYSGKRLHHFDVYIQHLMHMGWARTD